MAIIYNIIFSFSFCFFNKTDNFIAQNDATYLYFVILSAPADPLWRIRIFAIA